MSHGALSSEAHETLAIGMNRIKGASCSGEGGEDSRRFKILENGDSANSKVKQVASARFGVTIEYLNNCSEIEIKIAPKKILKNAIVSGPKEYVAILILKKAEAQIRDNIDNKI